MEYRGANEIRGDLIFIGGVRGASFDEIVAVKHDGRERLGKIIRIDGDVAVVLVFEGTRGLSSEETSVKFTGKLLEIDLSEEILGREFDGLARPRDGLGKIFATARREINGTPLNPAERIYPRNYICTGFSAIDELTTLIRGQKLPIFSADGLPHDKLALQIAAAPLATSNNYPGEKNFSHDEKNFSTEKISSENFSNEKTSNENFSNEKIFSRDEKNFSNENFSSEKFSNEKISNEKTSNEKTSNEKISNEKTSNENFSNDEKKFLRDEKNFSNENFSSEKFSNEKISNEKIFSARNKNFSHAQNERFAVVFAAMGISHDAAEFFRRGFVESGQKERTVFFLNLVSDPPAERLATPRFALTAAEFLAYDCGFHVLVILTDMTAYAESLREISSARGEIPGRKGFPGYMYSDFASIYERAGIRKNKPGSITQIPILTMPADDITHPIPDLTGYITEGQIVLDRALHNKNIFPPINILPSLSRLMKTAQKKPRIAAKLFSAYAEAEQIRALAAIVGEEDLTARDKNILRFAKNFEEKFLHQTESRSSEQTLSIAEELLGIF
ncbi:MAG: V-type ATP synthase subunit B [Defluviitaleaceae bacterium]|nr:V-type ATP synthase subunit B [Defluviitaleaceae bacterium]